MCDICQDLAVHGVGHLRAHPPRIFPVCFDLNLGSRTSGSYDLSHSSEIETLSKPLAKINLDKFSHQYEHSAFHTWNCLRDSNPWLPGQESNALISWVWIPQLQLLKPKPYIATYPEYPLAIALLSVSISTARKYHMWNIYGPHYIWNLRIGLWR